MAKRHLSAGHSVKSGLSMNRLQPTMSMSSIAPTHIQNENGSANIGYNANQLAKPSSRRSNVKYWLRSSVISYKLERQILFMSQVNKQQKPS